MSVVCLSTETPLRGIGGPTSMQSLSQTQTFCVFILANFFLYLFGREKGNEFTSHLTPTKERSKRDLLSSLDIPREEFLQFLTFHDLLLHQRRGTEQRTNHSTNLLTFFEQTYEYHKCILLLACRGECCFHTCVARCLAQNILYNSFY